MTVLIIGAGPAGLFAAAELARHGVPARLVERDVAPHRQARGTAIKPGTLEILESVGLLPAFLEASMPVHGFRLYGPDLAEVQSARFDGLDCRHSFECSLPQYATQRILEDRLVALGGRVERGVTAAVLDAGAGHGSEVELMHADGRTERVQPSILIGAGGAHSVTRHAMNDALAGSTYEGRFLVADIAMPAAVPHDESAVVCARDGMLLLSPLPNGRWITFEDVADDETEPTAAAIVNRIEARLGGKARPTDVAWFSPFRMHRRTGRALPAALEDPVAAALAAQARAMIDIDFAGSPLVADHASDAAASAGPRPGQRYADWTLLGGTAHRLLVFGDVDGAEALAQLGRKWAGRVEFSIESALDRARAGVPDGGCVLVRPDGHIGFRHLGNDAAAWAALDRHLATYLIPPT